MGILGHCCIDPNDVQALCGELDMMAISDNVKLNFVRVPTWWRTIDYEGDLCTHLCRGRSGKEQNPVLVSLKAGFMVQTADAISGRRLGFKGSLIGFKRLYCRKCLKIILLFDFNAFQQMSGLKPEQVQRFLCEIGWYYNRVLEEGGLSVSAEHRGEFELVPRPGEMDVETGERTGDATGGGGGDSPNKGFLEPPGNRGGRLHEVEPVVGYFRDFLAEEGEVVLKIAREKRRITLCRRGAEVVKFRSSSDGINAVRARMMRDMACFTVTGQTMDVVYKSDEHRYDMLLNEYKNRLRVFIHADRNSIGSQGVASRIFEPNLSAGDDEDEYSEEVAPVLPILGRELSAADVDLRISTPNESISLDISRMRRERNTSATNTSKHRLIASKTRPKVELRTERVNSGLPSNSRQRKAARLQSSPEAAHSADRSSHDYASASHNRDTEYIYEDVITGKKFRTGEFELGSQVRKIKKKIYPWSY